MANPSNSLNFPALFAIPNNTLFARTRKLKNNMEITLHKLLIDSLPYEELAKAFC